MQQRYMTSKITGESNLLCLFYTEIRALARTLDLEES